ncbi:hypothetical protein AB0T83_02110 [Fluviibacterium sp. DFM31]|uniref:Uncharacterized protein n=1 Tax=Meridianimarinicoccus marinus TaxID=3231483 RepID=A0ABV3L200_9RHOB
MIQDVRTALDRSSQTLWKDLVGVAALGVTFVSLLHLPALLATF